ncbi:uncharacterized protein M6B38_301750 [Iris pallida]|uniref:Uncharacterized protein n=1 Tax=Iris pallida TaxID=29817 RepID=A0AAX6HP28_IRIPA|nr:uncharacterized protein M6B38_301750 [Iris pallida]
MSFRESSAAAVFQYLASASEAGAGADDTVVRVGVAVGLGLLPRVREKRRECNLLPGLLREELMVLSTGTTVFLSRDEGRHLLQRTEKLLLLLLLLAVLLLVSCGGVESAGAYMEMRRLLTLSSFVLSPLFLHRHLRNLFTNKYKSIIISNYSEEIKGYCLHGYILE